MPRLIRRRRIHARRHLRIITWNCRGAFRKKHAHIAALKPDILIVQECEVPEKWPDLGATAIHRIGDSPHKGLAVISFGPWHSRPAHQPPTDLRYFLPMHIAGPIPFNLLGIWAMERCDAGLSYVGQVRAAIERYAGWLSTGPAVVAGDWNANAIWDRPDKGHTPFWNAVTTLQDVGLCSAYHAWNQALFGGEQRTTYTSNKGNHYHIDYCFIPRQWAGALRNMKVGGADWTNHSDHRPIIVDLVI